MYIWMELYSPVFIGFFNVLLSDQYNPVQIGTGPKIGHRRIGDAGYFFSADIPSEGIHANDWRCG
jgi:hypothetical protein